MQNTRKLTHKYIPNDMLFDINTFSNLIKSFEQEGFKEEYPIHVNRFLELMDGSHRFSLALYNKTRKIPVILSNDMYDCRFYYGIKWFEENGFTSNEIDTIISKYEKIKESFVKHYIGIIWSPAMQYSDKILNKIRKDFNIYECENIEFTCSDELEKFIRDIYKFDIISEEKIDKKIQVIKSFKPIITIFKFDTYVMNYIKRVVEDKLVPVPMNINKMKEEIRKEISSKIKDYYYDVVIHMNDGEKDFFNINEVVNIYKKTCIKNSDENSDENSDSSY